MKMIGSLIIIIIVLVFIITGKYISFIQYHLLTHLSNS